jgi:hypothetical protein
MAADEQVWCRITILAPDGSVDATWLLKGPGAPDLAVVDWVARCFLLAGRAGRTAILRDVCQRLEQLIRLAGLCGKMGGQPEQREETLGIEERVEPGDPPF